MSAGVAGREVKIRGELRETSDQGNAWQEKSGEEHVDSSAHQPWLNSWVYSAQKVW